MPGLEGWAGCAVVGRDDQGLTIFETELVTFLEQRQWQSSTHRHSPARGVAFH
jgi:hypothetical protein